MISEFIDSTIFPFFNSSPLLNLFDDDFMNSLCADTLVYDLETESCFLNPAVWPYFFSFAVFITLTVSIIFGFVLFFIKGRFK